MRNVMKTVICTLVIIMFTAFATPIEFAHNVTIMIAQAGEMETRAYIYQWYYKVIDGHLYKRLFNATTEEWVGDWILVE